MAKPAVTLAETTRGKAICETTKRFDILLYGTVCGQLWWNMRGYVGSLPCPDGTKLSIGEASLTEYRREIAGLNKEFAVATKVRS
jgi:hypothetical protein